MFLSNQLKHNSKIEFTTTAGFCSVSHNIIVFVELLSLWEEIKKKIQASDNKNKEAHGFGSCDIMLTGGAPMHRDTVEYFMTLGMPIINLYGMSESTGAVTRTRSPKARHGSCGTTNSGMEIKISNPDQHGIGEVST